MVRMPALALALAQAVTVLPTLLACGANAKPAATAKLPVPDAALRRDPGPSGGSPVGASDLARGAGAPSAKPDEVGLASWYGDELNGRKTASGERFDARTMSAAGSTLAEACACA
jgi:rare lipoprotein A